MMKVLYLIDWFTPAKKAGGPIKSMMNLIHLLGEDMDQYVITGNRDLDGTILQVQTDRWKVFETGIKVLYLSRKLSLLRKLISVMKDVQADIIYVNGIFSFYFSIYPLCINSIRSLAHKLIIAPRGMLHSGALEQKSFKKMLYLKLLKRMIRDNVFFHATDSREKEDILKRLDVDQSKIQIIGNVPDRPLDRIPDKKLNSPIQLSLISRLTEKKNIHGLIQELNLINEHVHLDICGEFESMKYKNHVLELIKKLPSNIHVEHHGFITPSMVPDRLREADYFILLTKGENFGHAIYEALSQGVPVICSEHTPWTRELESGAGYIWRKKGDLIQILDNIHHLSQAEYRASSRCALLAAQKYADFDLYRKEYLELLNIT